jgi:SAM-dependent methyltransferase
MQLDPLPDPGALDAAYAAAASSEYLDEVVGQRATAVATMRMIEGAGAGRGRLLDLGCWVGFLLDEARQRGWEVTGVEPSAFAVAQARALGLMVHHADLFTAPLPRSNFDAVVLADVIEHLVDPGAALTRIGELTVPGGVLALLLPDAGSRVARLLGRRWWSVIPTHVQYFTRRSLVTLLGRHGFQVLKVGSAPKAFTVRYYLERLRGYWPPAATLAVRAARALGVADRLWAPDFRDRMIVLARSPGLDGILPKP